MVPMRHPMEVANFLVPVRAGDNHSSPANYGPSNGRDEVIQNDDGMSMRLMAIR